MNKIRQKLTSQSGASITYALLLFLVCAVVSSVVLAAGTAASGRMSQAVESDKRYYSVTSAAEFLKNQIDGKTVVKETVVGSDPTTTAPSKLLEVITNSALGDKGAKTFTLSAKIGSSAAPEVTVKAEFAGKTVSDTDDDDDDTDIDKAMVDYGGADLGMTLLIYNTPPSDKTTEGNSFSIVLTFTADVEKQTRQKGASESTTVDRVTWNYFGIRTVDYSVTQQSEKT